MALRPDRRVTAGLLAVCCGSLSPLVSERVLAHRLGLAGPPALYASLGVAALAAVAAFRYSPARPWRYLFLYAGLAVGGALVAFVYLFGRTAA